jgi:hypothetical protein
MTAGIEDAPRQVRSGVPRAPCVSAQDQDRTSVMVGKALPDLEGVRFGSCRYRDVTAVRFHLTMSEQEQAH